MTDLQRGYKAAYTELYAAIDSDDHPGRCAGCRPCVLFRAFLKDTMRDLAQNLSRPEADTLNALLMKAGGR